MMRLPYDRMSMQRRMQTHAHRIRRRWLRFLLSWKRKRRGWRGVGRKAVPRRHPQTRWREARQRRRKRSAGRSSARFHASKATRSQRGRHRGMRGPQWGAGTRMWAVRRGGARTGRSQPPSIFWFFFDGGVGGGGDVVDIGFCGVFGRKPRWNGGPAGVLQCGRRMGWPCPWHFAMKKVFFLAASSSTASTATQRRGERPEGVGGSGRGGGGRSPMRRRRGKEGFVLLGTPARRRGTSAQRRLLLFWIVWG